MLYRTLMLISAVFFLFTACKKNDDDTIEVSDVRRERDDQIIREYLAANQLTATKTSSGLYYKVKTAGSGDALHEGDTVNIEYEGTVMYGKMFSSTRNSGTPMKYIYRVEKVVPGFQEAVSLLKPGGRLVAYIPSYLGYKGAASSDGSIPGNANLIFDIEIKDVRRKKL